jgi:hypothetical protein
MAECTNTHTEEIISSHSVYVSKPKAVAKVIEEATPNVGNVAK